MSRREGSTDDVAVGLQSVVLRHGLPGVSSRPALRGITAATLQQVGRWAVGQRLSGVWCDLLDESAGDDAIDNEAGVVAAARAMHATQVRTSLVCEATAARAIEALDAAGVQAWLIKGLPTAHLDYPDPAWRTTGDVDVLVRRHALHDAVAALAANGFHRSEPAPRPRWETRYGRAVMLRSEHGVEVDLHVAIAPGFFGAALDHAQLSAHGRIIDLGGVHCGAIDDAARLLGSCYAAVLSRGPNARYLRDLAQQLLVTEAEWQRAAALARTGDGESVLAAAVEEAVAADLIPADHAMVRWARRVVPSARARRALRYAQQGRSDGWLADARSQAMALGPLDAVRFVAGAAVPPRRVRAARGLTVGRQFRRGLRFARLRR